MHISLVKHLVPLTKASLTKASGHEPAIVRAHSTITLGCTVLYTVVSRLAPPLPLASELLL